MKKKPAEKRGKRREALENLLEEVQGTISSSFCSVISINPISGNYRGNLLTNTKEIKNQVSSEIPELFDEIARKAIDNKSGTLFYRRNIDSDLQHTLEILSLCQFIIVVPLLTRRSQKPIAVIFLGFSDKRQFANNEKKLLEVIKNHYESLLENIWSLGRYKAVIDIGQNINKNLKDYKLMFEKVVEEVSTILDTRYYFLLAIYQPYSNTLDKYKFYKKEFITHEDQKLDGACEIVINEKKGFFTNSLRSWKDKRAKKLKFIEDGTQNPDSLIFIPLKLHNEVLGVLSLQQIPPNSFEDEDIQILELLGNQIALALNSLRLFSYLKDITQTSSQLVKKPSSSQGLLQSIVTRIKKSTRADIIVLYPFVHVLDQDIELGFRPAIEDGNFNNSDRVKKEVRAYDIAALALKKTILSKYRKDKDPIWQHNSNKLFKELGGDVKNRKGNFEKRENIKSTALVTLLADEEPVGVLFLNYRQKQNFDAPQKLLIETLAQYTAIAIKTQRTYELSRKADFEILQKIDELIAQPEDLDTALEIILNLAKNHIKTTTDAVIFLYNPSNDSLEMRACIGDNSKSYENQFIDLKILLPEERKGFVLTAFITKTPQLVPDVSKEPNYLSWIPTTMSELDVPLIDAETGKVIGVINLEGKTTSAFNESDRDFLITLASQASLAVKVAQVRKRFQGLTAGIITIYQVIQETTSNNDNSQAMKTILKHAIELVNAELGVLQLYNTGLQEGHYSAVAESIPEISELQRLNPKDSQKGLGIINKVAMEKDAYRTGDAKNDPFYQGSELIKSELAVPLLVSDVLIGVLDVESSRPDAFTSDDEKILELFAGQAVLGVQSARNKKRLELLNETSAALARILDFSQEKEAYRIVIDQITKFIHAEILIRREDKTGKFLDLVEIGNRLGNNPTRVSKMEGFNGRVATFRKAIICHDRDKLPPDEQPLADPAVKSIIVYPIESGERYFGNLVLSHTTPNIFSPLDIMLIRGVALELGNTLDRLEIKHNAQDAEERTKALERLSQLGIAAGQISHKIAGKVGLIDNSFDYSKDVIKKLQKSLKALENNLSEKQMHLPRKHKEIVQQVVILEKELDKIKAVNNFFSNLTDELMEEFNLDKMPPVIVDIRELIPVLKNQGNIRFKNAVNIPLCRVKVITKAISQILEHLINNALQELQKQRSGGEIKISAFQTSSKVFIEISDTGKGISLKDQDLIFKPFFTTKGSSGLGLYISKLKALSNEGDLILKESIIGQGTTFQLFLPIFEVIK